MISLQGVSVKYRLIKEKKRSFQAHLINYFKGKRIQIQVLWALRDISLNLNKGESLGIIGHNGAGKSTLLKVVSGVIKPAGGIVKVNGKIAPLIELSAGFDPELTGRENIYLNASILGFSRKEIDKKYDSVVEFSELRDFIDTPLKNYSSGMIARLGFSIATEVDPDILIIDEVLAVGDAWFKEKSKERILEFRKKGVTTLFVSHNMEEIKSLCSKVLWLEHGKIKMLGDPESVISEYGKEVIRFSEA
ncbi:MAG: ABC transporter ATP-binding protein [Nitrospirae bacterium]|jgi:ABC-2 type transport system ATP-binding protein|nr:ABC transporter ATP-binding protein [Nitrospirota bacterium]